jgi:hypothetical protein
LSDADPHPTRQDSDGKHHYRAITRHSDGRIIHVRDIQASSDEEAIQIVTARGADIRTDLYGEDGLIRSLGVRSI